MDDTILCWSGDARLKSVWKKDAEAAVFGPPLWWVDRVALYAHFKIGIDPCICAIASSVPEGLGMFSDAEQQEFLWWCYWRCCGVRVGKREDTVIALLSRRLLSCQLDELMDTYRQCVNKHMRYVCKTLGSKRYEGLDGAAYQTQVTPMDRWLADFLKPPDLFGEEPLK